MTIQIIETFQAFDMNGNNHYFWAGGPLEVDAVLPYRGEYVLLCIGIMAIIVRSDRFAIML